MRRFPIAAHAEVETYFPEAELDSENGVAWLGCDYIDSAAGSNGIFKILRGVQTWSRLHHEIAQPRPMSDEAFKRLLFRVALGVRNGEKVQWAGVCRVSQLSHQILGGRPTLEANHAHPSAIPAIIYDPATFLSRSGEKIAAVLKESIYTSWWHRGEEDQPLDPETLRLVQHIAHYPAALGAITLKRCISDQPGRELVSVAGRVPDEPNGKVWLRAPGPGAELPQESCNQRRVEAVPYLAGRIASESHRSLVRAIMERVKDHETRDNLLGTDEEIRHHALLRGRFLINRCRLYHTVEEQREVIISAYGSPCINTSGQQDTYYTVQRFGVNDLRGVYFHHSNPQVVHALESDSVPSVLHLTSEGIRYQGSWIPLNNQLTPLTREIVARFYA